LQVFGRTNTFRIRTTLMAESEIRLREKYVEGITGSLRVPFPDQGIFTRELFVSYLDEDLLVVRSVGAAGRGWWCVWWCVCFKRGRKAVMGASEGGVGGGLFRLV
jgi:hypothetical protein